MSKKHKRYNLRSEKGLDRLTLVVGVIQPLMTLPQIILVYSSHDASQISIVTWVAFDIASAVLLVYGIKHRLLPIIVSQIIWLIVQTTLILGILRFR